MPVAQPELTDTIYTVDKKKTAVTFKNSLKARHVAHTCVPIT